MEELTLVKTRLFEGVWEGVLSGPASSMATAPQITVTMADLKIENFELRENSEKGFWVLRIPVPVTAICDGIQTVIVRDSKSGEKLNSFAVMAGDAMADDLRAEIDLLRAELDMLKRAFRRHCLETM